MPETFKKTDDLIAEKDRLIHPVAQDIEDYRASLLDGTRKFRGLATGIDELDELIGGIDRFVLLAGRSGAGKTTLALQMALGVLDKGTPVIIYSFEMPRNEIITSLVKLEAKKLGTTLLHTDTIELKGNDPDLPKDIRQSIDQSLQMLSRTGVRLYIRDSKTGIPPILPRSVKHKNEKVDHKDDKIVTILDDINHVKDECKADEVLVLIDSVQDIVDTTNPNQTQAEIEAVNDITRLQQLTGATILVTAQKNKGSISSQDSYGDVMGSMSFIHKPNTVLELITVAEAINKLSPSERNKYKDTVAELEAQARKDFAKPMLLKQIKGRFTGTSALPLSFYGRYGYFDTTEDINWSDVYGILKDS